MNVLQDILKQLAPEKKDEISRMGEREVVEELYKVQKVKSCLVVVDDIWRVDDWNSLRPAFPIAEASLSKILLTTRKENVAKVGILYPLGFLNKEESWELLQKKAFCRRDPGDSRIEPKLVEDLGREMVAKCGDEPLAISVIGGILREKNCLDGWKKVHKVIDSYLRRSESSEGDQAIVQVLTLSYDDLPYHLKPCFLYMSHYPEDKMIQAEELCLCWMAEGIVSSRDQGKEETLMDVAERYFNELASRSLVQVQADEQFAGSMQFCRLHDLMRELYLAKSEEEEFFQMENHIHRGLILSILIITRIIHLIIMSYKNLLNNFDPFCYSAQGR
ncbi:probable disease resistance protein At1g58390 [Coffea arabica]|uniref:Probable disease resistance protein At1g58390 n=1 Tax=Coffea arabica TaxID=13443 RepID=A0ABM4X998_COFAR